MKELHEIHRRRKCRCTHRIDGHLVGNNYNQRGVFPVKKTLTVLLVLALAVVTFAAPQLIYEANFNKTDGKNVDWVPVNGDWDIDGEYMVQYDLNDGNTNIWQELAQYGDGLFIYEYKITYDVAGGQWAPAAGLHFMASDGDAPQRGNSYLVFQDLNEMQLYRCEGGGIVAVQLTGMDPAIEGQTNVIRVEFETITGRIAVFLNDKLVIEWFDDYPILDGDFISLRTNQTAVRYDYVKVWYQKM